MKGAGTPGASSDGGAVWLRRRLDGCGVVVFVVLLLAIWLWREAPQEPHWLEELAEAAPVYPALALALCAFLRVKLAGVLGVDLEVEVSARAALLRATAERLEDGSYQRLERHGVVSGRVDGFPVGARAWIDPSREPERDALVVHVVFDSTWRCRLERRPTDGEQSKRPRPATADEEGWLKIEGTAPEAVAQDLRVRRALLQLMDEGHVLSATFDQDGLTVDLPANRFNLSPSRLTAVLDRLIAFVIACGVPAATRVPALVARAQVTETCPYCRDTIHAGSRATCEACRTPHHDACLAECGCTVLGCRGQRRASAPAVR